MTQPALRQHWDVDPPVHGSDRPVLESVDTVPTEHAHAHELTQTELLELVRDVAFLQDGWEHLVEHDPEQRRYYELSRDDQVSVWLICWNDQQDTGFHDHVRSPGAVAVVAGQIREERLTLGGRSRTRIATAGESFTFAGSDVHRISSAPGEPAVTIHAHSPPLRRVGAYDLLPDGGLRRRSMFRRRRTPSGATTTARSRVGGSIP